MGPTGGRYQEGTKWRACERRQKRLLAAIAVVLLPAPAQAAAASSANDWITISIVVAAAALAAAGALWALAEMSTARRLRKAVRLANTKANAAISGREALLVAGRDGVVAWGRSGEALSFGGGAASLEACLSGPDALALSMAIDALSDSGTPFALDVRTPDQRMISVRGRPAGAYAAVFLGSEPAMERSATAFEETLDALPLPVWLRDKELNLKWVNRAFLAAAGAGSLEEVKQSGLALERSEPELAAAALATDNLVEAKRYSVLNGQRRALAFSLFPIGTGIAGCASDVTALAEAEAKLRLHIDAHAETLDRMATAVAIFGPDRKLAYYNHAYAALWEVPETWLDTHPDDEEILDRLRELRRLPEQKDFQSWKQERLKLYERMGDYPDEIWPLPNGQTMRVITQPHPLGGLMFLYEDVSDRVRIESLYNTLIKVQKATLDSLHEAVAVFGPDGRLKLHNAAFAKLWRLESEDLSGEPHLSRIAETCAARFGPNEAWDIIRDGVATDVPERRHEWDEVKRGDGAVISLALSPLPDGATLVSFVDVTDRSRIETALRDRNEALEAANRIKSEFVKRVSYELRTPLNSILGFSEMLKSGVPGALNAVQNDYLEAVVKSSSALRDLINDILDLSQLEAGAMELDLQRIDLFELLAGVTEQTRDWAAKAGLALELQCRPGAGTFVGDAKRLRQVLANLISNSFKFTPRGGVIAVGGQIEGEDVQIFVSDTGPGMAEEVRAAAFDSFTAKSAAATRGGAGLGLALVSRFVSLHGGWVELDSFPGRGTRVTCHLPRNGARESGDGMQKAVMA